MDENEEEEEEVILVPCSCTVRIVNQEDRKKSPTTTIGPSFIVLLVGAVILEFLYVRK
jgi:hypothetical protein